MLYQWCFATLPLIRHRYRYSMSAHVRDARRRDHPISTYRMGCKEGLENGSVRVEFVTLPSRMHVCTVCPSRSSRYPAAKARRLNISCMLGRRGEALGANLPPMRCFEAWDCVLLWVVRVRPLCLLCRRKKRRKAAGSALWLG